MVSDAGAQGTVRSVHVNRSRSNAMIHGSLPLLAIGILLSGCATYPMPDAMAGPPIGYQYSDSNHPNYVSLASPAAIYNATRGTWLWPPATGGRRD
jgi:hypothetical protein